MINRSLTRWVRLTLAILGCLESARWTSGLQYQPEVLYNSGEECALILDGPGRSSAFDYTYNLLRGSFPPSTGGQTCITYDAVNHAYIEARKRIDVAQPKTENWRGEDLATVGELLLDISVNLAQKYGLTYDEVEKGLPLIDTSKTLIREVCPAFLSNVECRPGKYRRYDGLCTNLENPTWGATMTPFTRLLPPRYSDGINAPRISITGNDLPLARVVSRTMHPDEGYHDHAGTVMVIAWGQFMDHDYTLTATPLDAHNRNDPEECCNRPPHQKNPYCNEILIPEDDYFYKLFNVKCMDFVRGFPAPRPGCRLGSRVQFNLLTGVLDGNTVYGVSETFARKLRTGYGGLLRMNPVFSEYGLKDLLPLKLDIPDEGCTRPNRSMFCFEAGEIRVNEQLVLTCMHTLLAREHNRAAEALAQVNPHWDDETIFQEARRITIAEIQHVTYNEFLPILLGKDVMQKFGLLLEKEGYWDGYDPTVNPGVIDAFAAAAYRFGHSLLPTAVERWSKAHKFIASKRLSDLIRRPYDLYRAGVLDEYFMGLMNQVAQAMDDSITQEVTNHLFKKVGAKHGMDLVSFNMQRGREFGIPSYMEFRKFCGLPGADTFEELFGSMPNETISRYSSIFEHPADVDLWSGGVSERPLPGSMLGPTFACIIATQFSYSRRGDRFWYELPNQPSSFTPEQLAEIRKSRLARLICDNTDLIDTIQLYPMVLPDHEINPRVPCRSGVLPGIDFSKWAEYPAPEQAARYNGETKKSEEASRRKIEAMSSIFVGAKTRAPKPSRNRDISEAQLVVDLTRRRSLRRMQNLKKKSARKNAKRRTGESPLRRSRRLNRPMFSIRQSTTTFSKLPASESYRNAGSSPGYLLERSELEISPLQNIFREKQFSLRTFLGGGMAAPRKPAPRTGKASGMRERSWQQKLDPVSKLVQILTGKTDGMSGSLRRSKRDLEVPDPTARDNHEAAANVEPKFKRKYTPIFRECNHTAASEISDLNTDPPLATGNTAAFREIDYPRAVAKSLEVEGERVESSRKSAETKPLSALINGSYINLQDHQKETRGGGSSKDPNGYPLDIAPYNPDVIPYVDVPDYTDQREDSLDEDDRRVAKERYVDADVIDPSAQPRFEKIIVRDDDAGDAEEDRKADDVEEERKADEAEEERGGKSGLTGEDEARGDRKVEESEDATLKDEVGEKPPGPKVEEPPAVDFTPVHFDINEYRKPFNLEKLFEEFGMSESGESEEEKKEASNKKETSNKKESNEQQGSRNVPVHEPNQEAKFGDDFPDFSSHASPRAVRDGEEGKTAATREENTGYYYPDFEKIFGSATAKPFTGFFDAEQKSDSEQPVSYRDENTYERLFTPEEREDPYKALDEYLSKVSDERGEEGGEANEEEKENVEDGERYAETSDEDQDETQQQKSRKEAPVFVEKELSEKTLGPTYKTLEKIMEKKDDVSRLDSEVAENAKMKGLMPKTYKNQWYLEYESPKVSSKR